MKNNVFELRNNILKKEDKNIKMLFTTSVFKNKEFNLAYQVTENKKNVLKNRKLLADDMNKSMSDFIFCKQTHSTNIKKVNKENKSAGSYNYEDGIENTDGLYTYDSDIVLGCFYADCTPIYIYDKTSGFIAILHAGWQGSVDLIAKKMINILKKEKLNFESINVIFGPNIKKDSFEVDIDVYLKYEKQKEEIQNFDKIYYKKNEKYYIDNIEFNKQIFIKYGVLESNILICKYDTYENEMFFSYRRDKNTGRMIGLITKENL